MEAFKVAPYDQNLCLNGQYLTDNSKTLGHLRVLPKSLIYLRADEPNPGISAIEPDDGWNMQHPEEGFKGMYYIFGFIHKCHRPNFPIFFKLYSIIFSSVHRDRNMKNL